MPYESAKRRSESIRTACRSLSEVTENIEVHTITVDLSDINDWLDSTELQQARVRERLDKIESLLEELNNRLQQKESQH